MNVLFIYPRLLSAKHSVGGVAEFLFAMSPALRALGINPIIYAGNKSQKNISGPVEEKPGVVVYSGPIIKPGWFYSRRKMRALYQLCEQLNIDVVHAQGTYTAGFIATLIHQRLNIPYVVTSHSDVLATNTKRLHRSSVRSRYVSILKQAAAVTHLTPMMEEASHYIHPTQAKSFLIGNGIADVEWQRFASLPTQPYLFSVGRLERGKGFHILIAMYAELIKKGFTLPLVIAGEGGEATALIEQAKAAGLSVFQGVPSLEALPASTVIFTGYLRGEDKMRWMSQCQIMLFATQPALWDEAFGIVLLEAMAAGRALVSSDIPVVRYLQTQGLQACLAEADNIHAWAAVISDLLQADNACVSMGLANRQAAANFAWPGIAKQYVNVYEKVLA